LASRRRAATAGYPDRWTRRLPFGSVMHPRHPALRPPFVERPSADPEIGAHLRDGEIVPLSGAADRISAEHDTAAQSQCHAGDPVQIAEPAHAAACPW